jgi:hypothetical protein
VTLCLIPLHPYLAPIPEHFVSYVAVFPPPPYISSNKLLFILITFYPAYLLSIMFRQLHTTSFTFWKEAKPWIPHFPYVLIRNLKVPLNGRHNKCVVTTDSRISHPFLQVLMNRNINRSMWLSIEFAGMFYKISYNNFRFFFLLCSTLRTRSHIRKSYTSISHLP